MEGEVRRGLNSVVSFLPLIKGEARRG